MTRSPTRDSSANKSQVSIRARYQDRPPVHTLGCPALVTRALLGSEDFAAAVGDAMAASAIVNLGSSSGMLSRSGPPTLHEHGGLVADVDQAVFLREAELVPDDDSPRSGS